MVSGILVMGESIYLLESVILFGGVCVISVQLQTYFPLMPEYMFWSSFSLICVLWIFMMLSYEGVKNNPSFSLPAHRSWQLISPLWKFPIVCTCVSNRGSFWQLQTPAAALHIYFPITLASMEAQCGFCYPGGWIVASLFLIAIIITIDLLSGGLCSSHSFQIINFMCCLSMTNNLSEKINYEF